MRARDLGSSSDGSADLGKLRLFFFGVGICQDFLVKVERTN